jgi:23S rRNA pseudouridine1911/1915/1917 synthase
MDFPREGQAEPAVVYEDQALVAVYKPPRMHSAPGLGRGDLCAWTYDRYPDAKLESGCGTAGGPGSEGGLLHRLDYETSGLVLFARNAAAYASLLGQQERGVFYKEYLALVSPSREAQPAGSRPLWGCPDGVDAGAWAEARDTLDSTALSTLLDGAISLDFANRERDRDRPGREASCRIVSAFRPFGPKGARVACLEPEGAGSSPTRAKPLYRSDLLAAAPCRSGPGEGEGPRGGVREDAREDVRRDVALQLRLGIARGFRHQIRAQLAWIGLPILGDPLYGGGEDSRLRLYAVRLAFEHPISGNALSIELE